MDRYIERHCHKNSLLRIGAHIKVMKLTLTKACPHTCTHYGIVSWCLQNTHSIYLNSIVKYLLPNNVLLIKLGYQIQKAAKILILWF